MMKKRLEDEFLKLFGSVEGVRYFFAPGRVNLMGEHIDYNGGYTLPCALTIGTYAAVRKNGTKKLRLYSSNYPETGVIEAELSPIKFESERKWANYPLGVIRTFQEDGYVIPEGMDIVYNGTLPSSSGLSSSASIEVLTAYLLCGLFGFSLSAVELAKLTQRAENEFIGVQCGILDQLSIAAGRENCAIFLDTSALTYEYAPLDLGENTLLIVNSNKIRALNESKYNERRQECEEALRRLQTVCDKKALCHFSEEEFETYKGVLKSEVLERRARHAVYENLRTVRSFEALKQGDIVRFGALLPASHQSLKEDYEVTGKELDTLAELSNSFPGVLGARMTGAGFGGCMIAVIEKSRVSAYKEKIGAEYFERCGYRADFYEAEAGGGPCEI